MILGSRPSARTLYRAPTRLPAARLHLIDALTSLAPGSESGLSARSASLFLPLVGVDALDRVVIDSVQLTLNKTSC
jgi:hypothetical protein